MTHSPPTSGISPFFSVFAQNSLWTIASVAGGLLMWEVVSTLLIDNKLFLAAPSQVAMAIVELWKSGELIKHITVSFSEFAIGYVLAGVFGIMLGLLLATSRIAKLILNPWVSGLYATPTIALAPLFLLWFGIGIWSKVAVVVVLVIFPVIINTEVGLRTTRRELLDTVRTFGANKWQLFIKVSLPSALPYIFAGLRLGIGRGLIAVVVGELFAARAGLGSLIAESAGSFNMPNLFAGVVVLATGGIIMNAAFATAEKRIVHWAGD